MADFGSCRGIYAKQPFTEYISTRWYRAPECLLTDGYYNYKMDIWGLGCVFFEVLSLFPLFPGNNELDQVHKIHNILGTPPREILDHFKKFATHMEFNFPDKVGTGINQLIPHVTKECQEFISKLLAYNPDDRPTARQALNSSYMKDLRMQDKKDKQSISIHPNAPPPPDDNTIEDSNTIKNSNRNMGMTMQIIANNSKGMKKVQQGNKIPKHNGLPVLPSDKQNNSSENDEQNTSIHNAIPNQLPPILKQQAAMKFMQNLNDYKNIMKQTYSNNNLVTGKKVDLNKVITFKKPNDHKKNYISPYSLKAINKS